MNIKLIYKECSTRFVLSAVQPIRPDNQVCRVYTVGGEQENNDIYTTDCLAILKEVSTLRFLLYVLILKKMVI